MELRQSEEWGKFLQSLGWQTETSDGCSLRIRQVGPFGSIIKIQRPENLPLAKIDEIAKNPAAHGVKTFLLNRQRDRDTGKNLHLLMNELSFTQKQDVQLEKDSRSYKGWRFTLGQRVRGQHSRTTGRSGFTVGVMKKAIKEQKAAAAAGAQEKGKGAEKKK